MKRKTDKTDGSEAAGDAAWQRLTAQTRPLSAAQRNRQKLSTSRAHAQTAKKTEKAVNGPAAGQAPEAVSKSSDTPTARLAAKAKAPPRPALEPKARRRLSRGRTDIDATLDMHGMTLVEAQAALNGFIAHHRARGHKWVLVITGKGMRGEGRLRAALPDWLATPALAAQVVEYEAAALSHGGSGAFYLRLRK